MSGSLKVLRIIITVLTYLVLINSVYVSGCLITNCPRGGKRSGKFGAMENSNMKQVHQCISCGPGGTGQCFGPKICCGPFGCLLGTPETIRCQRDGMFHELEPCIAGTANCKKNTGRCATDGMCCSQDSCHVDRECLSEDKKLLKTGLSPIELFNILNYQPESFMEK
ncbi:oxytocin-neurophysin 1-like [Euwallacea fornicatus]|uniref:oxytocin-neurophysin 1-like n=1 Tax=Euwallacea fornicatus TaxID=995702 RepID=UPI00338F0346